MVNLADISYRQRKTLQKIHEGRYANCGKRGWMRRVSIQNYDTLTDTIVKPLWNMGLVTCTRWQGKMVLILTIDGEEMRRQADRQKIRSTIKTVDDDGQYILPWWHK